MPVLYEDLTVTISRQDRLSDAQPGRMNERPLPLRLGPMEARRDLELTLWAWARHVAKRVGVPAPRSEPNQFLLSFLPSASSDQEAGQLADEVGYAVIIARRAVDKPLELVYVGPCDKCTADLYAHPKSLIVACRQIECDAEYKVAERREWLLEQARDQLLTASEISKAIPGLLYYDKKLTSAMIRGWAHHGRIVQRPAHPSEPGKPRYRVGDVIEVFSEILAKETSAKLKKAVKKPVKKAG